MEIPMLPDDILFMVFGELTTQQRIPLGTSCKRFREIDFEMGKKLFKTIVVNLKFNLIEITGTVRKSFQPYSYVYRASPMLCPELPTHHCERLFRKSKTRTLKISAKPILRTFAPTEMSNNNKKDVFQMFTAILQSIQSRKICITFTGNYELTGQFIRAFFENRNLEDAQVLVNLILVKRVGPTSESGSNIEYNINMTKNALLQLPKIGKLNLRWIDKNADTEAKALPCVRLSCTRVPLARRSDSADDKLLLHLVSSANHVELCKLDCTVKGIMDAFETARLLTGYKFFRFAIDNAIADELFSSNRKYGKLEEDDIGLRGFSDNETSTIIFQNPSRRDSLKDIIIGEICAEIGLKQEAVVWN